MSHDFDVVTGPTSAPKPRPEDRSLPAAADLPNRPDTDKLATEQRPGVPAK
jgi:hypothetical protein